MSTQRTLVGELLRSPVRCRRYSRTRITITCLLVFVYTRAPAEDWKMVPLDLHSSNHRVIDLSVSETGVLVLTSQDHPVKVQTRFGDTQFVDTEQFTLSQITKDGVVTATTWDPSKDLPADTDTTAASRAMLRLVGFTKSGVAGRADMTLSSGPGMARAFVSTPQGRIWLPKPDPRTFEALGPSLGFSVSQPVCVNAIGWIAGEWVVRSTNGATLLPVVWLPTNAGGYQAAPLITKKTDYKRYDNLKIQDMSAGWMVGFYGPEMQPTPFIIIPQDGVAQDPPAFDVHTLPLLPESGEPAFDIGVATGLFKDRAVGWVARKDKPADRTPVIWTLTPSFGGFDSKLLILGGGGSTAAVAGKNIFVHSAGQLMVYREKAMVPLTIQGTTFSWLAKHRSGVAVVRVHDSKQLAVIRLPDGEEAKP